MTKECMIEECMTVNESKQYIRDRITALRVKKNVSEYEMSKALDRSKSYIQGISSGRSLPSMESFLMICEYLEVSARDFFDVNKKEPVLLNRLMSLAGQLSPKQLSSLISFTESLLEEDLPVIGWDDPEPEDPVE